MEKVRKSTRVVINIQDIEQLTGLKPGSARLLYIEIKDCYKKGKRQFITYPEFCRFTGIAEDLVLERLR